jgi:hypothetical protein
MLSLLIVEFTYAPCRVAHIIVAGEISLAEICLN